MPDFPRNWIFDEDGDAVAGAFVRLEEGQTKDYGPRPIVILNIAGEERSVWLFDTVIRNQFADEVRTRQLAAGERITVKRLGKVKSETTGREYRSYATTFHDRPQKSQAEILGAPVAPEPIAAAASAQGNTDDSIPF
ncbi:MAG TPA: hypothetical protein VIM33_07510 [Gaiellaceae bacterium]